jgi:hypothetical protein
MASIGADIALLRGNPPRSHSQHHAAAAANLGVSKMREDGNMSLTLPAAGSVRAQPAPPKVPPLQISGAAITAPPAHTPMLSKSASVKM